MKALASASVSTSSRSRGLSFNKLIPNILTLLSGRARA